MKNPLKHSRSVRVTQAQVQALDRLATAAQCTPSDALRYLIRRAYARPAHPPAYYLELCADRETGAYGPSSFCAPLRTTMLRVRVSASEVEMLEEMARQHGCPESAYLRALLIDAAWRTDPTLAAMWADWRAAHAKPR